MREGDTDGKDVTAYRIWDPDEPNLGVFVVLDRIPLELAGINGVVEQPRTLGRLICPVWVVSLVFSVVCGDDGCWLCLFLCRFRFFKGNLFCDTSLEI